MTLLDLILNIMENSIIQILNKDFVRHLREKNWYTQFEMANVLKIERQSYNHKENWKCDFTISEFFKILEFFWYE